MQKILISGGSGAIGQALISHLEKLNYSGAILSRSDTDEQKGVYHWDPSKEEMDVRSFDNCDAVINLAGASIAGKFWTQARKNDIVESRVKSLQLLYQKLQTAKHNIRTLISASAIGIYGDGGDQWKSEKDISSGSFLSDTCIAWENEAREFEKLGIRVVILRIGVLLTQHSGALPVMAGPVRYFAGSALGTGKQFLSWIHINDLCRIFQFALQNENVKGVYNATAPNPVSNADFYKVLANQLHRPLWPVNVPAFMLRLLLGEKSSLILHGQRVSSKKIIDSGFEFEYPELPEALQSIFAST